LLASASFREVCARILIRSGGSWQMLSLLGRLGGSAHKGLQ